MTAFGHGDIIGDMADHGCDMPCRVETGIFLSDHLANCENNLNKSQIPRKASSSHTYGKVIEVTIVRKLSDQKLKEGINADGMAVG